MTTKKIYGPWIKWGGGKRPVPPDTLVEVKLRDGFSELAHPADDYYWKHDGDCFDIVKYRAVTEQAALEAAEKLLRDNGCTVTPPARPLTFEDVVPMTEAPPEGTYYWLVQPSNKDGVARVRWIDDKFDQAAMRQRMAYREREHALIAARHIFGLKGGEL